MKCPGCGGQVSKNAKDCPACGEPIRRGSFDFVKLSEATTFCAGLGIIMFGPVDLPYRISGLVLILLGIFGTLIRI